MLLINNGNIKFSSFIFGGGETHIKLDENGFRDEDVFIKLIFTGNNDIFELLMVTDAIKRINKGIKIHLDIPYFPAARQDRVCDKGEAFSLKVYADIINSQNYESVTIFDPHSDVTPALINNVKIVDNCDFVKRAIYETFDNIGLKAIHKELITLISPDAGANKKIFKLAKTLPWENIEVVRADKLRDVKDGKILETIIYCDDLKGQTCFIVDDILDGGMTFIKLAEKLKEKGAGDIYLVVSHNMGYASEDKLKNAGINKVFCHLRLREGQNQDYFVQV